MTDPAKELAVRLPGPLPYTFHDGPYLVFARDANGDEVPLFMHRVHADKLKELLAWINSTGAQLVEKDKEIAERTRQQIGEIEIGNKWIARAEVAEAQLTAATARVGDLEKALAPFAALANNYDGLPPSKYHGNIDFELRYQNNKPLMISLGECRAARDWLNKESGNG